MMWVPLPTSVGVYCAVQVLVVVDAAVSVHSAPGENVPVELLLKSTPPVGAVVAPGVVSETVAVQVTGLPVTTLIGVQATLVEVAGGVSSGGEVAPLAASWAISASLSARL